MTPVVYSNRNQGWLPSIFNDFFNDSYVPVRFNSGTTPAINVSEDEKEYDVEVAAPGMKKEDFKINIDDDDLVICMEKNISNEEKSKDEKKYLRREFSYSKFEQRLGLPDNVERKNITATMVDGILTIAIPKMTEEEKAKATQFIEIK